LVKDRYSVCWRFDRRCSAMSTLKSDVFTTAKLRRSTFFTFHWHLSCEAALSRFKCRGRLTRLPPKNISRAGVKIHGMWRRNPFPCATRRSKTSRRVKVSRLLVTSKLSEVTAVMMAGKLTVDTHSQAKPMMNRVKPSTRM
jgi:hypothetical protein